MNNLVLSMDVIFEILSRSSLQTVGKCRILSKECNSLTYESYFTNLHSERSKTISGFFLQYWIRNKYYSTFVSTTKNINKPIPFDSKLSLAFLPFPDIKILATTTEGLILCLNTNPKNRYIPEYYICKPSTKEYQKIPNPKTRFEDEQVAIQVVSLSPAVRYKIIRFSKHSHLRKPNFKFYGKYKDFRVEMFDSNTWKWTELEDVYIPINEGGLSYMPAVSVCGGFHWLTWKKNVFAYYPENQTWDIFSIPENLHEIDCLELVQWEGKLAVVSTDKRRRNDIQVFVMEDYVKRTWRVKYSLDLEPLRVIEPDISPRFLGFISSNTVLMLYKCWDLIVYKINEGRFDVLKIDKVPEPHGIFSFRADFEKINLTKT